MIRRLEVSIERLRFEGLSRAEAGRARATFESTLIDLLRAGPATDRDPGPRRRAQHGRVRTDPVTFGPTRNVGRQAAVALYHQVIEPEMR